MNFTTPTTNDDLYATARLIYQADKHFYNLFSDSADENIENILKMYEDDKTTFSKVKSIYVDDQMVGAILYYPAHEIRMRQMFSLPYLTRGKDFDNNILRDFSEGVPVIDSEGLYLSHLAIDSKYQGKGLCKISMDSLSSLAISDGQEKIILHVRRDNSSALRCYLSSGYVDEHKNSENTYIVLKKKLI